MLKRFGKKNGNDDAGGDSGGPTGEPETIHTSTQVVADRRGRVINAVLESDTISEHESRILADELTTLCLEQGSARLAIGMQNVTILTSAGIGLLVQLHKKFSNDGGGLAIYGLNEDLTHLMKLTRMDRLFKIATDLDAALTALK